jgi:replication factor A1
MENNLESAYEKIKDLKTLEEFYREIDSRKTKYDNLFTDNVIALLIIDELDRNQQTTIQIKDIHPGMECSIKGTIQEISEKKEFTRKNQTKGILRKCIISDNTGIIPLILWNDDTNLIEEKHVQNGSMIKIINGYTKKGYHGLELNVGRWSKVEINEIFSPKKPKNQLKEKQIISGIINHIEPTNIFFKEDGTEGFIAKILLKTKNGMKSLIFWDEQVKTLQQFSKGDNISIQNISYRYLNGEQELHVNGNALITKKKD